MNRDANSATNVWSDTLRPKGSPVKCRTKVVGWISCFNGVYAVGWSVPRLPSERVYSTCTWHHIVFRERKGRVHREELFGSAYLMSATRVLKTLRTGHLRNRCIKNDARAENHGICRKKCPEVQDKGQPRSSLLPKHGQCLHPLG